MAKEVLVMDMPEKANHPDYCDNGRFDKGWNACLDEIIKHESEDYFL